MGSSHNTWHLSLLPFTLSSSIIAMENSLPSQPIQLPPGFRFHPTDEELITHYLSPKLLDPSFSPLAIAHVDFNKSKPWDLPWKEKQSKEQKHVGRERLRVAEKEKNYILCFETSKQRRMCLRTWKAQMGEKEWYFFCVRDRKYPTEWKKTTCLDFKSKWNRKVLNQMGLHIVIYLEDAVI